MHQHGIILFWSNQDRASVDEVAALPGCMAHEDGQESTLGNIKDAVQSWIDRAQESGRHVPEAKRERLILT